MGKKKIVFLFVILFLFSLTSISSAPPPQTNINTNVGLSIDFPIIEVTKVNTTRNFNFHVFNISDGFRLQNSTANCVFHLYNTTGYHIITTNLTFNTMNHDWEIEVLGGNFSDIGMYSIQVNCDDGEFGGFALFGFDVTPNGQIFTTGKAISYIGFIIILLFTFFITMYGGWRVRWEHLRSDEGKIVTINHFRYIKVFLFTMAYFELMFLFGLSYKFFSEANMEGFPEFFNLIYQLFSNFIFPLMILLIIIVFAIWISNKKLMNKLKINV